MDGWKEGMDQNFSPNNSLVGELVNSVISDNKLNIFEVWTKDLKY